LTRMGTGRGMRNELEITQKLDLSGEVCPYTFVKTTLALEEMLPGQILQVTLDHGPAVENVPRSLANRGHEVVDIEQVSESAWKVTVKKGARE
ncbi:MAG: sulfurtransferase TusA family protein, partial [Chloroflexota bacterium]